MLSPDLVILKGGRPDLVMECSPDQCCFYERINGGKAISSLYYLEDYL